MRLAMLLFLGTMTAAIIAGFVELYNVFGLLGIITVFFIFGLLIFLKEFTNAVRYYG